MICPMLYAIAVGQIKITTSVNRSCTAFFFLYSIVGTLSVVQIPFFPLVKKDLTFVHFGNDSRVDGLVNFEKLRMIAKEVRQVTAMSRCDATGQPSTTVSFTIIFFIFVVFVVVVSRRKSSYTSSSSSSYTP